MNVRTLHSTSQINENQWDNLVQQTDGGCLFHRTGWLKAIETGIGREPRHIVAELDGNPVAICPNFVTDVDLPPWLPARLERLSPKRLYSIVPGFGGPLVGSKEILALDKLFEAISDVCRGPIISHRIRSLDSHVVRYAQPLKKQGYHPSIMNCRFWFDLEDGKDEILNQMDKERRKEIRDAKANSPDIQAKSLTDENVEEFYEEYEKTMSRVGGLQYPIEFFEALSECMGDNVVVFSASLDGVTIGEHLCLLDDIQNSVYYFFNGVDEQYFNYAPSSILHDFTIEWAIDNGYAQYDLGSTNANFNNGVFQYKSKFGCRVDPIYSWERGYAPISWWVYSRLRHIYHRYSSVLDE